MCVYVNNNAKEYLITAQWRSWLRHCATSRKVAEDDGGGGVVAIVIFH